MGRRRCASPYVYAFVKSCLRASHKAVTNVARKHIPSMKMMRFGPAGFTGTVAHCYVVNAGVFS